MPFLELAPPDWKTLLGGTQESAWLADRNRKFGLAAQLAQQMISTADSLERKGLLFRCTPAVLLEIPFSADYYVSLAGFSMKTLQNIRVGPANFGLTRQPKGLVERLRLGKSAPNDQLEAFSEWITSEIDTLFPPNERERRIALATVLMILGGRVLGRGQNLGGDDAVDLVKTLLVEAFEKRGVRVEVQLSDGAWMEYRAEHNLPQRQRIRFGEEITCEFVSGGDRPDIIVFRGQVPIAVGEIKGRKDLSNVWESWMPGVYSHMRTWTNQNPDAARLFFGTLINEAMVEGTSLHGTPHVGLKMLHKQGLLNAAFNISKVAENDADAVKRFDELAGALEKLIRS